MENKIIRQIITGIIAENTSSGGIFGGGNTPTRGAHDILEFVASLDDASIENIRKEFRKKEVKQQDC